MKILHDVPLGLYSTMRLGGKADSLVHVYSKEDLIEALKWAEKNKIHILMVGSGSNIVWRDEGFSGLLIVNDIPGYEVTKNTDTEYRVKVGAGENWDSVVERSVLGGASGIEALSLIPGKTGATPVQNVGAYGQEVAQTIISVEVYDRESNKFILLSNEECKFAYRSSIFNTGSKGKYFILSINFKLNKSKMQTPFYSSLQEYLTEHNISDYTPANIRKSVIAIRSAKLPDPSKVANCGSFFANPLVDNEKFLEIQTAHSDIKHWPAEDNKHKLSAAWLIEKAGFKDLSDPLLGMATWPKQPLVLINVKARHTSDLLAFKQRIIDAVEKSFGVTLVQEPELLP